MKLTMKAFMEQVAMATGGKQPDSGKGMDIDTEMKDAQQAGNKQLSGLLNRKKNLTVNMDKLQNQLKDIDVQIAQAKAQPEPGAEKPQI